MSGKHSGNHNNEIPNKRETFVCQAKLFEEVDHHENI